MRNLYFKYYWEEESTQFFMQYCDDWAVKQIEITAQYIKFLSSVDPAQGDSVLTDQPLNEADLSKLTPITKEEFDEVWKRKR